MHPIQKLHRFAAAAAVLFVTAQPSHAAPGLVDSISLEAGGGQDVQVLRFSAQKNFLRTWRSSSTGHLSGYWDANVAYWRANEWNNVPDQRHNLAVVGLTPVFRYEANNKLGFYAEAGVGASLFSDVYRNSRRHLSTAFEFADHLGAGYVFSNHWELGARLQHYSNGGIKHPNGGVNLFLVKLSYHY